RVGTSGCGTFETCRPTLKMSVYRARPEVTVKSTRLPESDIAVRKSVRQRREAEGALEAFGEVCHRMRRPKTSRTAPYNRLSLNAEGGGANGHAQPLRAARRCLQHRDRRGRPHRPRDGRSAAQCPSLGR